MAASAAQAQRADENAIRSADDAFGSSIGNESIGLYSPSSVRGFSPFEAGNVRLEGLYYDAVADFDGRLVRGSTVRVGISAQGYPFPAPTGIADFRLRVPGDHPEISVVGAADSWGGVTSEVDGQLPILGSAIALGGGIHLSNDKFSTGGGGVHSSAAAILRIRPANGVEIVPFWSGFHHHGMDLSPIIVTSEDFLPYRIERGRLLTQSWAKYKGIDQNFGTIARWRHDRSLIEGGLFRSLSTNHGTFTDLFANTSFDGVAQDHLISASPPQKFASTSGELRITHSIADGPRLHTLIVAARGLNRERQYGGGDTRNLGAAEVDADLGVPEPDFHFGPYTRDHVRQESLGIGYRGQWKGTGELTLGLQRVSYRKDVAAPGLQEPPTKASPWLFNFGVTATPAPKLAIYGSYTRGLEESPAAPSFASNRDEAPPAIMTLQYDAGLRWNITPKVKLVAGAFDVEKPYFSIDDQRRHRELGSVRHRGAEISVVGQLGPRLSIVAGAIFLKARVSGEEVASGKIGNRPVGSTPRNIQISADYQLPGIPGLSADLTFNNFGRQPANLANTVYVPASNWLDLGLRYMTKVGGRAMTLRLQGTNVLNGYSWDILGSGAYLYTPQRQVTLRITTDW